MILSKRNIPSLFFTLGKEIQDSMKNRENWFFSKMLINISKEQPTTLYPSHLQELWY